MSATGVPLRYALDVATPLTLCALNFEVSIPADWNTDMIHLAIVLGDTGLYGLMKDKNKEHPFKKRKQNKERKMDKYKRTRWPCKARKEELVITPPAGVYISADFHLNNFF